MSTVYLVTATGGYNEPSYASFTDKDDAIETRNVWCWSLLTEPGDRVDFLAIDGDRVEVLSSDEYNEEF